MAATIQNHFIPEIQTPYVNERSTTLSRLWKSGLVSTNDSITSQIGSVAGNRITVPFNLSIEDDVATVGDYDLANDITPTQIASSLYQTQATTRAKAYEMANLDRLVVGNDPAGVLREQLGSMWENNYQTILLNQIAGVQADNVANDSSDMINNIYSDVVAGSLTAANLISADAIIDTQHTMGDHRSGLNVVIMHSRVRKQLEKDEPNNFIPASATNIGFDTYLGMVIIEDDGMTVTSGSNTASYKTILCGANVFQFGMDDRLIGEEFDRSTISGGGMGHDFLVSRRRFVMSPEGFDFSLTNPEDMASNTDYATAGNWDRKVASRKQVKMAILESNAL